MQIYNKALIIPINEKGEIMIQDRTGFNPPPWGFFGGSIEEGETPIQAVIRETKEELSVDIKEKDLIYIGMFNWTYPIDNLLHRHFFIWKIDRVLEEIDVKEGAGFKFVNLKYLHKYFKIEPYTKVLEKIKEIIK